MESIKYKGFEIKIEQDECPVNPFEEWDCEPPIIIRYEGRLTGYGIDTCLPDLTRQDILNNLAEVVALLGYASKLEMGRGLSGGYIVDEINDAIYSLVEYNNADVMQTLEQIYTWKGCPCLLESSHGYCHSAYAEALVIATPEWVKTSGCDMENNGDEILKSTIELYTAWAWGDVYGYVIEGMDDSCYGFYGDPEKSGLIDEAKAAIDWHIKNKKEEHFAKVKAYIKHHVPLTKREALHIGGAA